MSKFNKVAKVIIQVGLLMLAAIAMYVSVQSESTSLLGLWGLFIAVVVLAWLSYDRLYARIKALEDKEKEVKQ